MVEVRGMDEARAKMRKLQEDLVEHVADCLEPAAWVMANNAKERAPYKTGNLKRSIQVFPGEKSPEVVSVTVGTSNAAPYARYLEFGHFTRASKQAYRGVTRYSMMGGSGGRRWVAARPFMRPAFDETQEEVVKKFASLLAGRIARL